MSRMVSDLGYPRHIYSSIKLVLTRQFLITQESMLLLVLVNVIGLRGVDLSPCFQRKVRSSEGTAMYEVRCGQVGVDIRGPGSATGRQQ